MPDSQQRKVVYRKLEALVRDASGVKGVLMWVPSEQVYYFRVWDDLAEDDFRDYKLLHDDLSIVIDKGSLASLYDINGEEDGYLDHSPEVMN
ncbi:hypothetical protein DDZ13_08020 [Coraliomargarita sinensis]|uniref:Uncharacterized protein n=1 Tax=Coraliomargarita sinensis TaxID=2174842 RepID=A0A317ZES1_9BACT|nr:hypothetical protein [Coraliomargarita sinensis]PXA03984.1 hypothetical protein DDZ13_08020 [Coraliomargarita sinensis]